MSPLSKKLEQNQAINNLIKEYLAEGNSIIFEKFQVQIINIINQLEYLLGLFLILEAVFHFGQLIINRIS